MWKLKAIAIWPIAQIRRSLMKLSRVYFKIKHTWRVIGTGISFVLFGLGGPIIAITISFLFVVLPFKQTKKQYITRFILRYTFKLYINFMRLCGLLTYEFRIPENFDPRGKLVIANHPSLLDVVFLFSKIPNANCVVKQPLLENVFTRLPIMAAGYLSNSDPDLLKKAQLSLDLGCPLIIFPEGTRTEPGKPVKMMRGAANLAVHTNTEILPFTITCEPTALIKHQKWHDIPEKVSHFSFTADKPIIINKHVNPDSMPCTQARQLTRFIENYYNQRLYLS